VKPNPSSGLTVVELVIALVSGFIVLLIVIWMFETNAAAPLVHGRSNYVLSNMRQLYLATEQMTLDNQTNGNPVRWTCSGNAPMSFDQWHKALVPTYLEEKDFQKLLSISGRNRTIVAMNVFAVCDSDAPETVLFATKNWHGVKTNLSGEPFENRCFVIFRKAGDGAVLTAGQANDTNIIGSGGMHNFLPLK